MSFIAVAIGGSAIVGGIASIAGNNKAAKAQQQALTQSDALEREQIAEARRQYDLQRSDLAPYRKLAAFRWGRLGAARLTVASLTTNSRWLIFRLTPAQSSAARKVCAGLKRVLRHAGVH